MLVVSPVFPEIKPSIIKEYEQIKNECNSKQADVDIAEDVALFRFRHVACEQEAKVPKDAKQELIDYFQVVLERLVKRLHVDEPRKHQDAAMNGTEALKSVGLFQPDDGNSNDESAEHEVRCVVGSLWLAVGLNVCHVCAVPVFVLLRVHVIFILLDVDQADKEETNTQAHLYCWRYDALLVLLRVGKGL